MSDELSGLNEECSNCGQVVPVEELSFSIRLLKKICGDCRNPPKRKRNQTKKKWQKKEKKSQKRRGPRN